MNFIIPKLIQIEDLLNDKTIKLYVNLTNNTPSFIYDIYERIGIKRNRLVLSENKNRISAKLLIVPCVSPPIHPYILRRFQYLLHLPFLENNHLSILDKVIYFRNSENDNIEIINENDVINTIRYAMSIDEMLELIEYKKEYYNLDQTIDLLSNSKVIIGSHGNNLYNLIFAKTGTNIIEFLPDNEIFMNESLYNSIYIQSNMLGINYYCIMSEIKYENNKIKMKVDIKKLQNALEEIVKDF